MTTLALAAVGTALVAVSPVYPAAVAFTFAAGIGIAAYHPEGAKFAAYASTARRASGMSLFNVGGSLGYALGPIIVTALVLWLGLAGGALAAIPALVVSLALVRALSQLGKLRPSGDQAAAVAGETRVGAMAILAGVIALRSVAWFALLTFVPLWVVSQGGSEGEGNRELSLMLVAGVVGTLALGRTRPTVNSSPYAEQLRPDRRLAGRGCLSGEPSGVAAAGSFALQAAQNARLRVCARAPHDGEWRAVSPGIQVPSDSAGSREQGEYSRGLERTDRADRPAESGHRDEGSVDGGRAGAIPLADMQRPRAAQGGATGVRAGCVALLNASGGKKRARSDSPHTREALTRGPNPGRRDRAEPLARPTRRWRPEVGDAMRTWLTRRVVVGLAVVAMLALGGSVVLGAIPSGGGTIYACYAKTTGALRVVNYPTVKCASSEKMLSWTQIGPKVPPLASIGIYTAVIDPALDYREVGSGGKVLSIFVETGSGNTACLATLNEVWRDAGVVGPCSRGLWKDAQVPPRLGHHLEPQWARG